jgi:hypothetical protein
VKRFLWEPGGKYFFMLADENKTLYVGDAYGGDLAIVDIDVSGRDLKIIR